MRPSPAAALAALAAVASLSAAAESLPPLQNAPKEFAAHCATCPAETLYLPVRAAAGTDIETRFEGGRLHVLYRMAFNQITEGWNWHPEADPGSEDYYRYKYLPLDSVMEERDGYRHEDKPGEPQDVAVRWRYDYFFGFDNLYDFYPRVADDDAGFAADIPVTAAQAERLAHGDLRMALRGRLAGQCLSQSTTFWKATYSRPVDFTLKKRYLIGRLEAVLFYDAATGEVLAQLPAGK